MSDLVTQSGLQSLSRMNVYRAKEKIMSEEDAHYKVLHPTNQHAPQAKHAPQSPLTVSCAPKLTLNPRADVCTGA